MPKTADWVRGGVSMRAIYDNGCLLMGTAPKPPKEFPNSYGFPLASGPGGVRRTDISSEAEAIRIVAEQGGTLA